MGTLASQQEALARARHCSAPALCSRFWPTRASEVSTLLPYVPPYLYVPPWARWPSSDPSSWVPGFPWRTRWPLRWLKAPDSAPPRPATAPRNKGEVAFFYSSFQTSLIKIKYLHSPRSINPNCLQEGGGKGAKRVLWAEVA